MRGERLLAAAGTLALMVLLSGAVAHDIARRGSPYPAESLTPTAPTIAVDVRPTVPTSDGDEAIANDESDDDSTVP